jgi:hypothetical protein
LLAIVDRRGTFVADDSTADISTADAGTTAGSDGSAAAATDLSQFDTGIAHSARIYDYWLGGKDNFAADRTAGEAVIAARPTIVRDIRANRAFMHRAVAYLAAEAGLRQFLDVGTGIPTSPNVHEIAQEAAPDARIVYADNDPIVLAYARALLTGTRDGATDYIEADLREPERILDRARQTLDFTQPVAVQLIGMMHLISAEDDPYRIVGTLMDAVPSGSYLVVTHPASDIHADIVAEGARRYNASADTAQTRRDRAEFTRLLDGLEIIEPGVVQAHRWRPAPGINVDEYEVSCWAAIGRKP